MKENGFTLIELLAVLVILSILITITTVGFSSYVSGANNTYYKNLENTTRDAVMDFFADNRNYYPKQVGGVREIDIDDLVRGKYLEEVVDAKGKKCRATAKVEKKGANDYDYKLCIICPSHDKNIGDGC